ncbi:MAG: flagellar export chaperone FliS [Thermoguttaceae bacterium]
MSTSARENYLVTQVMTATPQKLQLMTIEAAIRSIEQTKRHWQASEDAEAAESLIRAQQVMGELLGALNRDDESDLVKKVAAIYLFVFRTLMEANLDRSEEKLNDALKVLKVERETWQQVCEKLGSTIEPGSEAATLGFSEATVPAPVAPTAPLSTVDVSTISDPGGDLPASGFSIEA